MNTTGLEVKSALPAEVTAKIEEGLALCRDGKWEEGMVVLGRLSENDGSGELPGVLYSYLGYAVARCQKRYRDGIKLCEHGIKRQFYEPDNYYNLARTRLLVEDRRRAFQAIRRGLKVNPRHRGLIELRQELGKRRPPVLPFLGRGNPLNVLLGKLRHGLTQKH